MPSQHSAHGELHTDDLALVVNTHWHADHVGANSLLQAGGAHIAASDIDAGRLLDTTGEDFAAELVESVLRSGALIRPESVSRRWDRPRRSA